MGSLHTPLHTPIFTGSSATATAEVPGKYDCAIAGVGYMLDRTYLAQQPMLSSIRATRPQSDTSSEPGEQSVNTDDLWRRSQQSWHLGTGQDYLDRDDSDRRRFRASKGIDPWTRGQISLLHATDQKLSSANTNLALMPAGSRIYVVDGTALKYATSLATDSPSFTTVTGTSGSTILSIASDGLNVWVADGAAVYKTTTGTGSASSWSTEDVDVLGYVKGRLMFSDGPEIGYFSDMSVPTATQLFVHASTSFTWVGFAEGPSNIYAAGFSGDKSLIYRIGIQREGVGLDAPIVAGELPDGEIIYSIGSYIGFVFLGTSAGVRFCTLDGAGNLSIGDVLLTSSPVRCFEGQGRFVWFGWTNYDGTSTGLGRLSLRDFADVDAQRPAYATDLMATAQGSVLSCCTFADKRVFAVSGQGVWAEETTYVSTGTLDSGRFNYGISEKKIPLYLDVTYAAGLDGNVASYIAVNGSSSFMLVGTHSTSSDDSVTDTFPLGQTAVDQVEVRHILTVGSGAGPTVLRHTIRSQPVPSLRRTLVLPLILHDAVDTRTGVRRYNVPAELARIEGWRAKKTVVNAQVGDVAYSTVVEDFDFLSLQRSDQAKFWQGVCITRLKTV